MGTYAWNAEDYERNSQAQQKWARELIGKLSLKGNEAVLDLGCGDGKVTAEIACAVASGSVIGGDSASAMIELAKVRYPSRHYSNLSFKVLDARHLSFEGCFDVVFSNAVLHWVKDHGPVVAGLFKSLRPGGKILLQMGGEGNASQVLCALSDVLSSFEWQAYFENFTFPYGFLGVEEYKALLLKTGFSIDRLELIPKDMEHSGKLAFEGWIRTTWLPYTECVPKEKRDKFIHEVSARYLEKVPMTQDGKVHVAMVRIEVEATKCA
jgi:trans-aconitate methyltransferase